MIQKDPTTHVRRKLIELCQQLVETITAWFGDISSKLMMIEFNYEKLLIIPCSAQNVYKYTEGLSRIDTPNGNDDFYMKLKIKIHWTFGQHMEN
jgi:hypothetical protein